MNTKTTARCGCGEVRFESEEGPLLQLICHCADCREASKEDFTTLAFFLASSTQITGALSTLEFNAACGSRTTREACSKCGSLLFDRSARFPTLVGVNVQNIDPPFKAEPSCHVWVKSRVSAVRLSDGLVQHAEDLV